MSDTGSNQVRDIWDSLADNLVVIILIAGALFAISIWGWQIFDWLRTGEWTALPFSALFRYFEIDLSFVYNPSSWQGLAQVGRWILAVPMAVMLPVSSLLAAWLFRAFISSQ